MKIRLPDDLKTNIENAARDSGRSMNAEIVARLTQSFNLEPMKEAKREELTRMVNEAIDERLELEKQRAAAQAPSLKLGAGK